MPDPREGAAMPSSDADRVAVLRNENSAASRRIADEYVSRRGLRHVISVSCPDSAEMPGIDETIERAGRMRQALADAGFDISPLPLFPEVMRTAETIDAQTYRAEIEAPARAFLAAHPEIDILVTTKGIPLRVAGVETPTGRMRYSLDALLGVMGHGETHGAIPLTLRDPTLRLFFGEARATAWVNPYWNSDRRFSRRDLGMCLVSRLDGYTVDDALGLTRRALAATAGADAGTFPTAPVLIQPSEVERLDKPWRPFTEFDGGPAVIDGEAPPGEFNTDLDDAATILTGRGVRVVPAERELLTREELLGYASWGSNDPRFDPALYAALRFAPGAIAETAVSTSARTMLPTPDGGQSLIADLVARGVTAVRGYTDEPLLQAVSSPRILFDRYTRGWTAVESFAAAAGIVGWQEVLVGDPLARAYPRADEELCRIS